MFYCNECKIYGNESIENLINYCSEWVSNIKYCDLKHDIKTPSVKYCRNHNLFLCEKCIYFFEKENIDNKNEEHEFVELYKLRKKYCIFHEQDFSFNCLQCNADICIVCRDELHKSHYIGKIGIKYKYMEPYIKIIEGYINKNENIKRELFKKVYQNILSLENYKKKEKGLNDEINEAIEKKLKIFYKYLKISINLLLFSKIVFNTYTRNKSDNEEDKFKIYNNIMKAINQQIEMEKIEEFNLNNLSINYNYQDERKSLYKSEFNLIPQVKLKFNEVEIIDKELIDNLISSLKEIFEDKNFALIEIKRGSLYITITLNYLLQEKMNQINEDGNFLKKLTESLGKETENIKKSSKINCKLFRKKKSISQILQV